MVQKMEVGMQMAIFLELLNGKAGHEIHETEIQGFLTNTNRFVSRKEAFEIARDANQIQGPNKGQQENSIGLTSEDLY